MEVIKKTGKIYRVYNIEDESQFYIGSTNQRYLASRMAMHRLTSKTNMKMKLYEYVRSLPNGWNTMKIELVELTNDPVTREELEKIEGKYQRELIPPLNKNIAGRKPDEYYQDNKEKLNEKQNQYNIDHKENVLKYQTQYRETHKEHQKAYQIIYQGNRKEDIKKYQAEYRAKHKKVKVN